LSNLNLFTYLLLTSFIDVYPLVCNIHHYCTSLCLTAQYLCNLCDTTLYNRRWFGSCSLLVSLIVDWSSVVVGPVEWSIYHHLVPKRWSPLLYLIILLNLIIPTLLSVVGGTLTGNGCGSPNHLLYLLFIYYLLLY